MKEHIFRMHLNFKVHIHFAMPLSLALSLSPFVSIDFFRKQLMCFVYRIDMLLLISANGAPLSILVSLSSSSHLLLLLLIHHHHLHFLEVFYFSCQRSPSDICAIDEAITKLTIHASHYAQMVEWKGENERVGMLYGNTTAHTLNAIEQEQ